jgi:uncharacterized iron-regulated membrane protein
MNENTNASPAADPTPMATLGTSLMWAMSQALRAYGAAHPDAVAGLVLALKERTTRLQLVVLAGGEEPMSVEVDAITGNDTPLCLARFTFPPAQVTH